MSAAATMMMTSSSTSAPSGLPRPTLPIKVFFETTHAREIRRTRIHADATWEEAIQLFGGLFPDSYVVVSYVDADGDTVTVETANEWKEALRQHTQSFGLQHTLRITLDATQPVTHAQPQHHALQSTYSGRGLFERLGSMAEAMMTPPHMMPHQWDRPAVSPDVVSLDSHGQGSSTHSQSPQNVTVVDGVEVAQESESQGSPRSEAYEEEDDVHTEDAPEADAAMALQASNSVLSSAPSSSSSGTQRVAGVRAFLPSSVSGAVDETIGEFMKQTSSHVATHVASTLRSVFANMRELFEVPILEPTEQPQQQMIQQPPVVPPVAIPVVAEQEQAREEDEVTIENDAYSTEFEEEEPEAEMPEAFEAEEVPAQVPPPPTAPEAPFFTVPADEEILFHMGFTDIDVVRQALQMCGNNVEAALDMLLAQAATPRF